MNPAEEIVKFWLQGKGYFVQSSIKSGRKEIDILAVHISNPNDKKHIEVSVSINMVDTKHTPQTKALHYRDCNFEHPRIKEKVQERFGDLPYRKELVIGHMKLGGKDETLSFIGECSKYEITVINFSSILKDVMSDLGSGTQLNAVIKTLQLYKKFYTQ